MNRLIFFLAKPGARGLVLRIAVLAALLGLAFLLLYWLTGYVVGVSGPGSRNASEYRAECLEAFGLVLITSLVGHVLSEYPRGDRFVLLRLTGPIWIRSGLLLLFLAPGLLGDLLNDSYIYYILAFYLTGLAVEIFIASLAVGGRGQRPNPG